MTKIITRWNFDFNKIDIKNIRVEIPGLPIEFQDYKIVQLSDFHLGTLLNYSLLTQIVEHVNFLEPDLIAITGDLVSSNIAKHAQNLIAELSRLSSKDGVFSVLGNHDHYSNASVIRKIYKQCQIIELNNQTHLLERNHSRLYLAGIDDYLSNKADLEKVVRELPGSDPVILLAHEPDFADKSASSGKFALQLSGHSHGGQIRIPRIGYLFLPPYGRKYPSGMYRINGMGLYTNRGLGTSWLKVRYDCPPEISVFSLQAQKS